MRPVRPILTTLLFVSLPLFAAEPPTSERTSGAVSVEIRESVQLHPRVSDWNLQRVCRAGYAVRGCTDFPKETLTCRCNKRGEAWFVDASARLDAVIHLPNTIERTRLLAHEQMHLTDLDESLRRHLESIASRPFDSRQTCDGYATFLSTSTHLRVVMNKIRARSNAKFGCDPEGAKTLRAAREDQVTAATAGPADRSR